MPTEMESKIERLSGVTETGAFFKDNDISLMTDQELLHLMGRLLKINAMFHLDAYVHFVRDEFNNRRQKKSTEQSNRLSKTAITVSMIAAGATLIQATVAILQLLLLNQK